MVESKQPTVVDTVLPEYIALHESTGETYASMADRVEAQGSEKLAERLRKLDDDSDAFKANREINRRAEQEKAAEERRAAAEQGGSRTQPPAGRGGNRPSTT